MKRYSDSQKVLGPHSSNDISRRSLLASISAATVFLLTPAEAKNTTERSRSLMLVDDPVTTQGGELTFSVWRKHFFSGKSVVQYSLSIRDELIDTDRTVHPIKWNGVLFFGENDLVKTIAIPIKQNVSNSVETATISLRALSNCSVEKNMGHGKINPGIAYYFSEEGSSQNLGTTPEAPLDYLSFPALIERSAPATIFLFRRGDTFHSNQRFTLKGISGGTDNKPIIIGAYGMGPVPVIETGSDKSAWWFRGSDRHGAETRHLIISDVQFLRSPNDKELAAHLSFIDNSVARPHHIQIKRCQFSSNNNCDSAIKSSSPKNDIQYSWLKHFDISFNTFEGSIRKEIFCALSDFSIYSNVFRNGGHKEIYDWAIYSSKARHGRIEDNLFDNWIQGIKLRANMSVSVRRNFIVGHQRVGINVGGDLSRDGRPRIARDIVIESNLIIGGLSILIMEQDNKPETQNPHHLRGLRCINNVVVVNSNTLWHFGLGIAHSSVRELTFAHNSIIRCGEAPAINISARFPIKNLFFRNNIMLDLPNVRPKTVLNSKKAKWFGINHYFRSNLHHKILNQASDLAALKSFEAYDQLCSQRQVDLDAIFSLAATATRCTKPLVETDFWSRPRHSSCMFGAIG